MPGAGDLREKVAFDARMPADPTTLNAGSVEGAYAERFRMAAGFVYLRGGEGVIASRLQGTQPVIITVRDCQQTREVVTDWRLRDVRRGTIYAIRAITPNKVRGYLDLLCEGGVVDG